MIGRIGIALACCLALVGCVATAGDLRAIADQVEGIERSLDDPTKTDQEVMADIAAAREEIKRIAEEAAKRGEGVLDSLADSGAAGGGVIGVLSAVGMSMWRDHRRRQRGEVTGKAPANPPSA